MGKEKNATLVLEDGATFEGVSIGLPGERIGEVILDTAVVGYQEIMSDTTNAGKIVVLTYPLIGNYGVSGKFYESERCWISGLVIKEESRIYSNWQSEGSFGDFLKKEGIVAINDVDTRTLAITIRDKGEMLGIISTKNANSRNLVKKLKDYKKDKKRDFIKRISTKKILELKGISGRMRVAILDLGILNSFIKQLKTCGCRITLLPYDMTAEKIINMKLDGLIISNGPEEDDAIIGVVKTVEQLLGKIPIMGISTGHEIIGLAIGGRLKKMRVGHHGVNYPVKAPDLYKGDITVQNHSFIVDENSIKNKGDVIISKRNINDDSIEEMKSKKLKFISIQYYPASPGFEEVNEAFKEFLSMAANYKEVEYAKT